MSEEFDNTITTEAAEAVPETTPEPTPAVDEAKVDLLEVPEKFRNAEGKMDEQKFIKSYNALEKSLAGKRNIPARSVDEYDFEYGEDSPYSKDEVSSFKQELLDQGFTKSQAAFMASRFQGELGVIAEKMGIWSNEKSEAHLKEKFGSDYETVKADSKKGFAAYAPSGMSQYHPALNDPFVIEMLAAVGRELGEDSVSEARMSGKSGYSREEIEAMMATAGYRDGSDPKTTKIVNDYWHGGGR